MRQRARPDLWGAGEGDLPGLPELLPVACCLFLIRLHAIVRIPDTGVLARTRAVPGRSEGASPSPSPGPCWFRV